MAEQHSAQVVNRARELWSYPTNAGTHRSTREVAKEIERELGATVTAASISNWQREQGWTRQTEGPDTRSFALTLAGKLPPVIGQELDWESKKLLFSALFLGVSQDCLSIVRLKDGSGALLFRDAESALKMAMGAFELAGKIQSGKFDVQSVGDIVPVMTFEQLNVFITGMVSGKPTPQFEGMIEVLTDGHSDKQDKGSSQDPSGEGPPKEGD